MKEKYFSFILSVMPYKITNYEYVTSASLSRILHWFMNVVDNFNVKTNLICNKSLYG